MTPPPDTDQKIDWRKFRTEYVKLEPDTPKKLKLTRWRQTSWLNTPGLKFDVLGEDDQPVRRFFGTTSKRLIRAVKPIIEKADRDGRKEIDLTITRTGDGFSTGYEVQEHA